MDLSIFVRLYLLSVPIFFAVDMIWLSLIARNFYRAQMGDLLTKNVNWTAAILFYFIFLIGVIFFAVMPAIDKKSLMTALGYGALFGFIAYATYDLTNLATIKNWPLQLTVVDMVWGAILSASVSALTFTAAKWFNLV